MKTNGKTKRTELGRFVVAAPAVCHGKPTFKGPRIMVWQLFEHLALGEPLEDFPKHFPGRVSLEAAREALELGEAFFAGNGHQWEKPCCGRTSAFEQPRLGLETPTTKGGALCQGTPRGIGGLPETP